MSLHAGTRLGPYEILARIGAGGMGEVYKASDTRLGREVAIKVSTEQFSERFEREARAISALNHPHICTLYDVGPNYLVMELVDGQTPRGPMPMKEALDVARQIVEAMEAAHEKGITHRDLKPANIKIKRDGAVKVLDFGLAKVSPSSTDLENSPTRSALATGAGVILGTPAYMAPEQARGLIVDKRADIWAFGVVLYELLTGKRMFTGDSTTDVLAGVVRAEPDWSALPATTPVSIRRLLKRCLEKDRKRRLPDIGSARLELDDATDSGPEAVAEKSPGRAFPRWLLLTATLLAGALIASGLWWFRSPSLSAMPMHLSIALAPGTVPMKWGMETFAISPDGEWLAYVIALGGKQQLFLRSIRKSEGKPIDGTDGAAAPFFSPDSQWIGFGSGKALKKVPVSGGSPVPVCNMPSNELIGGTWGPDNTIVFVPQYNGGIWTVSANGGTPKLLLNTDEGKDRIVYLYPQVLPDGKGVLFSMATAAAKTADDLAIAVLESGAAEPRILIPGGSNARYIPATGHIVYVRGGALLSVPFDLPRMATTGTPSSVTEGLESGTMGLSPYSLSQGGTLVYQPRGSIASGNRLAVVDRKGNLRSITDGRANFSDPSVSPDGGHVVARVYAVNDDLWTYDIARGTPLRLTSEPPDEVSPQWTPDGTRVAFGTRTGKIFLILADGTGKREQLSSAENPRFPSSFSPDGKTLAFVEIHPSTQRDIWFLTLDGERKALPFLNTDADEWAPKFSPDGHWLAYVSNETGRDEIYLRPIGTPGGRKQVSKEGGLNPVWARNRPELFFVKSGKIFSVLMDAQGNALGPEHVVVEGPKLDGLEFPTDNLNAQYDIMPDGEHFVIAMVPHYSSPTHYNVVLNWFGELKR